MKKQTVQEREDVEVHTLLGECNISLGGAGKQE